MERTEQTDGLLASLRSRSNRMALAFWAERRGRDRLPLSADVTEQAIRPFAEHVILLDVRYRPLDFGYRFIGDYVRHHLSRNLTGQWMRDIPYQKPPSVIFDSCGAVVESRAPASSRTPYVGPHKALRFAEDVIMPLADEAGQVDRLLVAIDYFRMA